MKKVVNKRFARRKKMYRKVLDKIERQGKCPFCPENFKYHRKPILRQYKGWFITENSWPYKNTKKHLLIISRIHKELLPEISLGDLSTVKTLAVWAIKKFSIKGGGLTLRFGDTNHTGATVCHLHFHLISPKQRRDGFSKTVNFPIG